MTDTAGHVKHGTSHAQCEHRRTRDNLWGTDFPFVHPKNPQPLADMELQGLGSTNTAHVGPHPPQGHQRMPVLPTKSDYYPGIGAGDGISPGIQGLGSAGEAHWGCVSEAAVSEPA